MYDEQELPQPQLGDVIERRQGPSGQRPARFISSYSPLLKGVFERITDRDGYVWRYVATDASGSVHAIMELRERDNTSSETLWHLREQVSTWWHRNHVTW